MKTKPFVPALVMLALGSAISHLSPEVSWSQEDEELELELSEEDFSDADWADEDFGSDEFTEEEVAAPEAPEAPAMEGTPDELTLEPLDEGTEEAEALSQPDFSEPVPEELSPEAPSPVVSEEQSPLLPRVVRDDPNLDYEAKLYDIYVNYHSQKMSDEDWGSLVSGRESEVFAIQKGDTLWGISQVLFGDGQYWPKIWQINSGITNPHLISPGNKIRFLMGTESEAPAFTITEAEAVEAAPLSQTDEGGSAEVVAQPDSGGAMDYDDGQPSQVVEIPPPLEVHTPVLRRVPPSLPIWSSNKKGEAYDDLGFSFGRRPILDIRDERLLEGFVTEQPIIEDGFVQEIEGGSVAASEQKFVFLNLPQGKGQRGQVYTAMASLGPLEQTNRYVQIQFPGVKYRVLGEIELHEKLTSIQDESTQATRDIWRAQVVKSIFQVEKGSFVRFGAVPRVQVDGGGARSAVQAQIVGGALMEKQNILSTHNLAFLSVGSEGGLEEGQTLIVRANNRIRNPNSIVKESYIPVGMLKVVNVTPKFSTAVVTKVWDTIYIGDFTGEGVVLPPDAQQLSTNSGLGEESFDEESSGEEDFDDSEFE